MGSVLFTAKSEPAIDWSEIESRLQEISAGSRPSDAVEPLATLANDPLATALGERAVSLSPYQDIFTEFRAATEASASTPSQSAAALDRAQADSK